MNTIENQTIREAMRLIDRLVDGKTIDTIDSSPAHAMVIDLLESQGTWVDPVTKEEIDFGSYFIFWTQDRSLVMAVSMGDERLVQ